jgi:protein disulfide-isomerase A6
MTACCLPHQSKMKRFLLLAFFLFVYVLAHGDGEHKPEDPIHGVVDVTSSNVDEVINSNTDALVEFYAPWCGHCKNLVDAWTTVGASMEKAKPKDVVVAKVNCVAEASLCQRYSVNGYPTIKFFAKGTGEDYQGGRSAEDFIEFLNKKTNARLRVNKAPTYATELHSGNFDSIVNSDKDVIVKFYTNWCGHCKQLAPKWEVLAKAFQSESGVVIAKLDADKSKAIAERFGVQGYPTLKVFRKGSKTTPEEFNRGTEEEMVAAVNAIAGTSRTVSGALSGNAGRIAALDALASKFVASDANKRKELLAQAQKDTHKNAQYYVRAMQKIMEQGESYAKKESERLNRVIAAQASASSQMDEFQIRVNILTSFE